MKQLAAAILFTGIAQNALAAEYEFFADGQLVGNFNTTIGSFSGFFNFNSETGLTNKSSFKIVENGAKYTTGFTNYANYVPFIPPEAAIASFSSKSSHDYSRTLAIETNLPVLNPGKTFQFGSRIISGKNNFLDGGLYSDSSGSDHVVAGIGSGTLRVATGAPMQTVYLEFGADAAAHYRQTGTTTLRDVVYSKPDSGVPFYEIQNVVNNVNYIYKDYNVNFTAEKPTSGPYHTIYVGGTHGNVFYSEPALIPTLPDGVVGVAESTNLYDANKSLSAVVFSGDSHFLEPGGQDLLAQVIAHEAGHLLGLSHVTFTHELMNPTANATATDISDFSIPRVVSPFFQNSGADLKCGVGSGSGAIDCSQSDPLLTMINDNFSTLYNAKVMAVQPPDDDAGALTYYLGDLTSGTNSFRFPLAGNERVVIEGSSTPDGEPDVFAGLPGFSGAGNDLSSLGLELADNSSRLDLHDFDFYQLDGKGGFSKFGSASLTTPALTTVPLPGAVYMMGLGILLLGLAGYLRRLGPGDNVIRS